MSLLIRRDDREDDDDDGDEDDDINSANGILAWFEARMAEFAPAGNSIPLPNLIIKYNKNNASS